MSGVTGPTGGAGSGSGSSAGPSGPLAATQARSAFGAKIAFSLALEEARLGKLRLDPCQDLLRELLGERHQKLVVEPGRRRPEAIHEGEDRLLRFEVVEPAVVEHAHEIARLGEPSKLVAIERDCLGDAFTERRQAIEGVEVELPRQRRARLDVPRCGGLPQPVDIRLAVFFDPEPIVIGVGDRQHALDVAHLGGFQKTLGRRDVVLLIDRSLAEKLALQRMGPGHAALDIALDAGPRVLRQTLRLGRAAGREGGDLLGPEETDAVVLLGVPWEKVEEDFLVAEGRAVRLDELHEEPRRLALADVLVLLVERGEFRSAR